MKGGLAMSDLATMRDHARVRAASAHRADCQRTKRGHQTGPRRAPCDRDDAHELHEWIYRDLTWNCPGICGGCQRADQRALWAQIADEIDAYLTREDDEPLWEDA